MNETFEYGGVVFEFCRERYDVRSTREKVVVLKGMEVFERYKALLGGPRVNILELGIFEGGSAILFALMNPEARIVAIDADRKTYLDDIVAHLGLSDRVKLHHGVFQQDAARLKQIIQAEFGDQPLDLVVDDASHMYEFSRQSFEILFPYLREGGHYVIEDWNWAHYQGVYQTTKWMQHPALTNLVFELVAAIGSGGGWAHQMWIRGISAVVQKALPYAPDKPFRLDDRIRMRGKALPRI